MIFLEALMKFINFPSAPFAKMPKESAKKYVQPSITRIFKTPADGKKQTKSAPNPPPTQSKPTPTQRSAQKKVQSSLPPELMKALDAVASDFDENARSKPSYGNITKATIIHSATTTTTTSVTRPKVYEREERRERRLPHSISSARGSGNIEIDDDEFDDVMRMLMGGGDGPLRGESDTGWRQRRKVDYLDPVTLKPVMAPNISDVLGLPSNRNKMAQQQDQDKQAQQQKEEEEPPLSEEQQIIHDIVVQRGQSVFFTGAAGTGKSFLLRHLIKSLRRKYGGSEQVAVTSSTGIAACNVGGMTLHSWAGIGLGTEEPTRLAGKVNRNKNAQSRWRNCRVLIVDEVSMLDGELFDKLEFLARQVRKNNNPFGGMQVILVGDFFQLPPVAKRGEPMFFCFEAKCWPVVIKKTYILQQVFRQKDDQFVRILNEMRVCDLSMRSIDVLNTLSRPVQYTDGVEATELYALRQQVHTSNEARLSALEGKLHTFQTSDYVENVDHYDNMVKRLDTNCLAPRELQLKVGAQVMLITNLDQDRGLVNGSVGIIRAFEEFPELKKTYPIVEFPPTKSRKFTCVVRIKSHDWKIEDGSRVLATRSQLPLVLAWAWSVHKSQGQTIDRLKIDLGRIFEYGQAYVALSRATSLDTLQVLNFRPGCVKTHPKVIAFAKSLRTASKADDDDEVPMEVDSVPEAVDDDGLWSY